MNFARQRLSQILLSFAMMALLLASVGLPHFGMAMSMDEQGNMAMDCYMPGMTVACNMTALEHIASWQSAFASVVQQYGSTLLLVLLSMAIVFAVWVRQQYPPPRNHFAYRHRLRHLHKLPQSSLQELFSNGILHPKVF